MRNMIPCVAGIRLRIQCGLEFLRDTGVKKGQRNMGFCRSGGRYHTTSVCHLYLNVAHSLQT